jgi:hypothetical protein
MAPPELASRLEDILEAIAATRAYTSGKTLDGRVGGRSHAHRLLASTCQLL